MMKYQQINSTFIPKEKSTLNSHTPMGDSSDSSKEKLALQIKEYNNKIKELEKQLKLKDTEIHSSNNLITFLEKEINKLKDVQNPIDTTKIDDFNIELNDIKEENVKLKKEIAIQNEHTQLLYVLIIILTIM